MYYVLEVQFVQSISQQTYYYLSRENNYVEGDFAWVDTPYGLSQVKVIRTRAYRSESELPLPLCAMKYVELKRPVILDGFQIPWPNANGPDYVTNSKTILDNLEICDNNPDFCYSVAVQCLQSHNSTYINFGTKILEYLSSIHFTQADLFLGMCYIYGANLEKNIQNGIFYLSKAIEQNNAEAMYHLGMYYVSNDIVEKVPEALTLLEKSGKLGFVDAWATIGTYYLNQDDTAKAFEYFTLGYKNRSGEATYKLYILYRDGCGVEQNEEKAMKCLKEAADFGDNDAQFVYGMFIYPTDSISAFEYWEKSARQGNIRAKLAMKNYSKY